jgi:serine/threonine protein phosphatase PrpC
VIELRAGAATDVGRVRTVNEDHLLVDNGLFAVADGMGGAAAGEVASAVAIDALHAVFSEAADRTSDALIGAALAANRAVWDQAEAHPEMRGMGTTLVALALVEGPKLAVINVGDSRLYAFHRGDLRQVTDDHNLVAEMVAEGRISKEEAEFHPRRNIMTRALGVDPDVPVDLFEVEEVSPGDRFLLCSDGLPREIKDDQIASMLRRLADPDEAAKELVEEAKRQGGNDNITVVVVDVVDPAAGDATVVIEPSEAGVEAPPEPIPAKPPAGEAVETSRRTRRTERRERRQEAGQAPLVTPRVVLFIVAILIILGGAATAVAWYARSGYYVGLKGQELVVYKGRPGGVLWFSPTVTYDTLVNTSQVLPRHIGELQAGQQEPSLTAAKVYVQRLVLEKDEAVAAAVPSTTLPPAHRSATTTTRPK